MSTPNATNTDNATNAVNPGEFTLPDQALWAGNKAIPAVDPKGPAAGTVIGLDIEKWAAALIDLNDTTSRVAAQRQRLKGKGYVKLEGDPIVINFAAPEVWVMPRREFEKRRAANLARMRARVAAGHLSPSATTRPKVEFSDPKSGVTVQVG